MIPHQVYKYYSDVPAYLPVVGVPTSEGASELKKKGNPMALARGFPLEDILGFGKIKLWDIKKPRGLTGFIK